MTASPCPLLWSVRRNARNPDILQYIKISLISHRLIRGTDGLTWTDLSTHRYRPFPRSELPLVFSPSLTMPKFTKQVDQRTVGQ